MPAIPKPRPKLLDRKQAKAEVAQIDRRENAKVRARSGGICEVRIPAFQVPALSTRCARHASHIHHLISGIGRRNIGRSIKAAHKLHVCIEHHSLIHGHVLKPTNNVDRYDAVKVRWERVK